MEQQSLNDSYFTICYHNNLFNKYFSLNFIMTALSDPSIILKMIESGVRSAIPWTSLSHLHLSMQKQVEVQSRLRNRDEQIRQRTLENEKSLSNSMLMCEKRRIKILSQKQKQMTQHSKKVKEKLAKYYTAQKTQFRKAATNQKRFSETISSYWENKTKQNQSRQRKIYQRYNSKPKYSENPLKSSDRILTQLVDYDEVSLYRDYPKQQSVVNRGDEARNRMQQISSHKFGQTFQKMMKKLAKIERRKRFHKIKHVKTQDEQFDQKQSKTKPPSPKRKPQRKFYQKPILSPTLMCERKKLPSHYQQNIANKKNQQQQLFEYHSNFLQDYRYRINHLDKVKQIRNKIIESKLYARSQQMRSTSHL